MNDSALARATAAERPAVTVADSAVIREENFVTRNLKRLRRTWQRIAGVSASGETARGALSRRQLRELEGQMHACVAQAGGEVSARLQAAALGQTYLGLDATGRREFLELMATFGPDQRVLEAAARGFLDAADDEARLEHERAIREAVRAPRVKILTQFTGLPDGVKFLVDMRADLLEATRGRPHLDVLERELSSLLALWFDVGFLELQRITWDSPASLLERLIAYEAVHEIRSWEDLRNRLDSDRRCYAFFHPRMPREPLIFVEVALSKGLTDSIQKLLDESQPAADPRKTDTAIFYSISSTQHGLRGISFGNFLIKRVVDELKRDVPTLRSFATLSPIPGYVRWLESAASASASLGSSLQAKLKRVGLEAQDFHALWQRLRGRDWSAEPKLAAGLADAMLAGCAYYLAEARQGLRPVDAVARFHLDNGARIERLNWLADISAKGLKQSAGIMVNYLYDPAEIESNHEAYRLHGKVALSADLKRLLRR
ncbi:MAG: malonyl-CoA decarboxylase [Burkholderiales bacterium]|nr:malonyl-CoA decarboxylase [Burkholderiales bacterium]